MNTLILITGGARSGKSRYALSLGNAYSRKAYIATARALDPEMEERIRQHRRERGPSYTTIETSIDLPQVLRGAMPAFDFILVDCLTLWLANLFLEQNGISQDDKMIVDLLEVLRFNSAALVLVTNEVGMGIVPDSPMGRSFRDLQGFVNQQVSRLAEEVFFMVSGVPLPLKKKELAYGNV